MWGISRPTEGAGRCGTLAIAPDGSGVAYVADHERAPLEAGGALALGGGLWLAGVMPTAGFALEATMWLLHATCHLALAGYAPPKAELKSRFALVDVRAAGHRMSAAKLQLRVGGYRKPRFWSFDDAAKYAPSPPNEHALPLALSPI